MEDGNSALSRFDDTDREFMRGHSLFKRMKVDIGGASRTLYAKEENGKILITESPVCYLEDVKAHIQGRARKESAAKLKA
jgi:hypothetical protein